MTLFAVHLPDFILPTSWMTIGNVFAALLALVGCWRMRDRDIPLVALITAAFFIASSIRVPVPYGSVHLILNGMVGIMLGYRAGLSLLIGLTLQALLVGHGGIVAIGVNTTVQAIPAFIVGGLFQLAAMRWSGDRLAILGGILSFLAVIATVALQSVLVWLAGDAGVMPAAIWLGIHIPVGIIEGIVVGFMIHFLARVKPELIGVRRIVDAMPESAAASSETRDETVEV